MNQDIYNLIHDEILSSYKLKLEQMTGYAETSKEDFLKKHPMISDIIEAEGSFDLSMIMEELGPDLRKRWTEMATPLFHKFLDELTAEEYQKLEFEVDDAYCPY